MKLRVQYSAQLRAAIGRPEEEVELPEGSRLAELLAHLVLRLEEGAAAHLVTSSGEVRRSLLVVVNDSASPACEAAATVLRPGDVVLLMPPIAGG
jgi:molybdopterin converting factor small subunit